MTANIARGEVDIQLGSESYVLVASFENIGKLQGAFKVEGFDAVRQKLDSADPVILMEFVRCMASEGDPEKVKKAPFNVPTIMRLRAAIMSAMSGPADEIKNLLGEGTQDQTAT